MVVSIGCNTIARDRLDYIAAISDLWKSQMLYNLVKIRYGDATIFLDVASVINQNAVEGAIGYQAIGRRIINFLGVLMRCTAGQFMGKYTDRPTITYLSYEWREVRAQFDDANPAIGDSKFSPGRLSSRSRIAPHRAYRQWHRHSPYGDGSTNARGRCRILSIPREDCVTFSSPDISECGCKEQVRRRPRSYLARSPTPAIAADRARGT